MAETAATCALIIGREGEGGDKTDVYGLESGSFSTRDSVIVNTRMYAQPFVTVIIK